GALVQAGRGIPFFIRRASRVTACTAPRAGHHPFSGTLVQAGRGIPFFIRGVASGALASAHLPLQRATPRPAGGATPAPAADPARRAAVASSPTPRAT